ncbi:hypothetical protein AAHB47_16310 [Bacillus wiedmannii]|nr:hypothetical protein [Bacillus wiedmannii]SCN35940.1 Protein of unknown function [Bacillus wiedmannii]
MGTEQYYVQITNKGEVKGKYVYSYDVISEKDIPEKIRGQLEIEDKVKL